MSFTNSVSSAKENTKVTLKIPLREISVREGTFITRNAPLDTRRCNFFLPRSEEPEIFQAKQSYYPSQHLAEASSAFHPGAVSFVHREKPLTILTIFCPPPEHAMDHRVETGEQWIHRNRPREASFRLRATVDPNLTRRRTYIYVNNWVWDDSAELPSMLHDQGHPRAPVTARGTPTRQNITHVAARIANKHVYALLPAETSRGSSTSGRSSVQVELCTGYGRVWGSRNVFLSVVSGSLLSRAYVSLVLRNTCGSKHSRTIAGVVGAATSDNSWRVIWGREKNLGNWKVNNWWRFWDLSGGGVIFRWSTSLWTKSRTRTMHRFTSIYVSFKWNARYKENDSN